jgi:hypothetical protein
LRNDRKIAIASFDSLDTIRQRDAMSIDLVRARIPREIDLEGVRIPDSKLAREITELVRYTEPPLLFHHSSRVYYCGALAGKRRGLRVGQSRTNDRNRGQADMQELLRLYQAADTSAFPGIGCGERLAVEVLDTGTTWTACRHAGH